MKLTWSTYQGNDFGSYRLHRYVNPNGDSTIATFGQSQIDSFIDTSLHSGSKYFYYIEVVDTSDSVVNTSNTVNERTLPNEYPFSDSISQNDLNFAEVWGSSWGIVGDFYHSVPYSFTDSPGSQYALPSDNSLYLVVSLAGSYMPVLSFWERHIVDNLRGGTHCYVEISDNFSTGNPTWNRIYTSQGTMDWNKVKIDLSQYSGKTVMIRFRLVTDYASQRGDGWWVDDITISESDGDTLQIPFFDSTDDSSILSSWIPSSWMPVPNGINGSLAWTPYKFRETGSPSQISLASSNVFDFSGVSHPQVQFYLKKTFYCSIYLEVSTNGGMTWDSVGRVQDQLQEFTRYQFNLSHLSGMTPRIRFRFNGSGNTHAYIDNILIKDAPADVVLEPATGVGWNSARITWHRYTNSDFYAYEVRRDTGTVSWSSPVIATFRSPADTTFYDSSLNAHTEYHYRVYVVDTTQMRSLGSNEISFETDWIENFASYPYTEDFENGIPSNWIADSGWGVVAGFSHTGTYSINESPDGNYPPNMDRSIYFGIDLTNSSMPVLSFWEATYLESGKNELDQGWVEISNDGTNWSRVYVVNRSHPWEKVNMDISELAHNPRVFIRFRFRSNNNGQVANGWFIDDISVSDANFPETPYPFFDDVENNRENYWIPSIWEIAPLVGLDNSHAWKCTVKNLDEDNRNNFSLVLGGPLDLTDAISPAVSFYIKGYANHTYLMVSVDSGPWVSIWNGSNYSYHYIPVSVDLSQFQGHLIRLKFKYEMWSHSTRTILIDNIRIHDTYSGVNVVDMAKMISPDSIFTSPGMTTPWIYGMVFEPNVTSGSGQGDGIIAQLGYGPLGTLPDDSSWIWVNDSYCGDSGNYDVYRGIMTPGGTGIYNFAFRFSSDTGSHWIYADLDGNDLGGGGFNGYEPAHSGIMVISQPPDMALTLDSISVDVPRGNSRNYYANVINNGNGPLRVSLFESLDGATRGDVPFITVTPSVITVQPSDTASFMVTFNGDTMTGTYTAWLELQTNDPDARDVFLPVAMNVLSSNTLEGTLVTPDGSPIGRNGFVEIYSGGNLISRVSTDAMGQFSIANLSPDSLYTVRCYADGFYPSQRESVNISNGPFSITVYPVPMPIATNLKVDFYGDTVRFDGEPLKEGDVITAFDPDGVLCGVYFVQNPGTYGFMHVYGDDPSTGNDEGAEPGDTLTFLVNEHPVNCTGPGSPVWVMNNTIVKLNFDSGDMDSVFLRAGWNLISFTVMPQDTDITSILSSIMGNVELVAGFDQSWGGARTFNPDLPGYSDLTSLDAYHGYWIKLRNPVTLVITGARVHSSDPIFLNPGWNLVSYLPEVDESVEIPLTSILGNIYVVDGFDSVAVTYRPGSPYNDLYVVQNGLGYWIKVYVNDTLDYSQSFTRGGGKRAPDVPPESEAKGPTPYWTDYYGNAFLNGYPVEIGDTITSYDPDGVLCGTFVVRSHGQYGFMHVYGDDPSTARVDEGAEPGDSIRFFVNGNYVATASGDYSWTGGRDLIEFDLGTMGVHEGENSWLMLLPISPNPVHGRFFVNFTVPQRQNVKISLFDVTGRKLKELVSRSFGPGRYRVEVDSHGLKSGVYFIQMRTEDFTGTVKFVVE